MSKEAFVDFSEFDENNVIFDHDEVLRTNPHRFEMQLLDGVLFMEEKRCVGYKNVTDDMFWVRGHFPERPLMPGIVILECIAQLSSFYAVRAKLVDSGYIGLGGFDGARFRGPVVPGDKLIIMLRLNRVRRNRMFSADFQGFVNGNLVVDGALTGVALGE